MGQCEDGNPVFGSYPAGGFVLRYGDHFVSGILTDWGGGPRRQRSESQTLAVSTWRNWNC